MITSLNLEHPKREVAETRSNPLENPAIPLTSAYLLTTLGGEPTAAGVAVSEQTAMNIAVVYSCVKVIAEDVGRLPLRLYFSESGVKSPAEDADLYYLLSIEPNPEMTSDVFFSTVTACAVLNGNGYAEIQRDSTGRAVALWPRDPNYVRMVRIQDTNELAFEVSDTGPIRIVDNADMLHIPGIKLNAYGPGISPVAAGKQTLGLHKAAELTSAQLFGNGAMPSGILTIPEGITDQDRSAAGKEFQKTINGSDKGRVAVMPSGFTYEKVSITPEDMQFLGTMQYTRSQIAGLFRVAVHMIGDTSKVSNSNMEQMGSDHVRYTLGPWLSKWEKEITRKLLPYTGRHAGKYSVAFDYSDFTRGDTDVLMKSFAAGRQWGYFSANDVRQQLGMNSIGPAGDLYLTPINMQDSSTSLSPLDSRVEVDDDETERSLISALTTAYEPLFRDSLGRVCSRDKVDYDSISRCFTPLLTSIAGEAQRQSTRSLRLLSDTILDKDKIVRDALKLLEKRSSDWTPTNLDTNASADLTRCVKAIVLNVYREAAVSLVLPRS